MSKLIECSCKHTFQDKIYNGKRLANKCNTGFRCTVCERMSISEVKAKGKK